MRILHIITSLCTGGAEKLMVDLLPKLRDLGNDVELLLFDGDRTEFMTILESKEIKIHVVRVGGSVYDPRTIFYLRKIIKGFDIVHTHNTSPQFYTAIANCLYFGSSLKLVTTEHNTINRRRDIPFFKLFDQWMYSHYAKIICISDQAEINLRRYLNNKTTQICTIYNGIDFSRFSYPINSFENANFPKKRVIVTMVAAFREQKDQNTLIRAISMLPQNYTLQLVGTGDKGLVEKSKNLVRALNLSDRVYFRGMRCDIPEILHTSDIIVLSSHYEGLSLSCLEGMASGKPFIASDVEGIHEIVNGYGLLFPHEDAKALSDIIIKLSKEIDFASQVAINCQKRAKHFDINIMAQKYADIYQHI